MIGVLQNSSATDIHGLNVARISELFEGFGYVCKSEAKVRGISGNLHDFDFICTKRDTGEKLFLESMLQVKGSDGQMEIEFVKLRLKTYDCSPDVCLVIVNSPNKQVREMANLYRLTLIDHGSDGSPYDQIESLLRLRDEDMTHRSVVPQ